MSPSSKNDEHMTFAVTSREPAGQRGGLWRNLGPGLITAAVVIGPGTITITSKIGATAGMSLVWALVATASFMMVFTAMSARMGILNQESILSLVARHYGRWLAILIGCLAFAVCAGFQSSNYIACSTALESLTGRYQDDDSAAPEDHGRSEVSQG
jgi:Mn2+/Fe2+ NRAMP family transporter